MLNIMFILTILNTVLYTHVYQNIYTLLTYNWYVLIISEYWQENAELLLLFHLNVVKCFLFFNFIKF